MPGASLVRSEPANIEFAGSRMRSRVTSKATRSAVLPAGGVAPWRFDVVDLGHGDLGRAVAGLVAGVGVGPATAAGPTCGDDVRGSGVSSAR